MNCSAQKLVLWAKTKTLHINNFILMILEMIKAIFKEHKETTTRRTLKCHEAGEGSREQFL